MAVDGLRRRAAALAALLCVLAVAVAGALSAGDDGDPAPTGQAAARDPDRPAGGSLLDALAPVLGAGAEEDAAAPSRAGGAEAVRERPSRSDAALRRAPGPAVAGLLVAGFRGTDATASFFTRLRARPLGGVLLGATNYLGAEQLAALTGEAQVVATQEGHTAPLTVASQEGGALSAFPDLPPRGQVDLGPAGPTTVRRDARAGARSLAQAGVAVNLAPVADLAVAGGPAQGRAFGDDPRAVATAVRASVAGHRDAGVAAVVRSFPGEGAAAQDPVLGPAPVGLSLDELRARDMVPFAAVARTAPAIQLSNAVYLAFDGVTPATLLPETVRELRGRLRFRGAIVSADLVATTGTTGGSVGEAAVAALNAGCDLLLVPGGPEEQDEAYREIVAAVRRGDVPPARVREAGERVARLRALTRSVRSTVAG